MSTLSLAVQTTAVQCLCWRLAAGHRTGNRSTYIGFTTECLGFTALLSGFEVTAAILLLVDTQAGADAQEVFLSQLPACFTFMAGLLKLWGCIAIPTRLTTMTATQMATPSDHAFCSLSSLIATPKTVETYKLQKQLMRKVKAQVACSVEASLTVHHASKQGLAMHEASLLLLLLSDS